MAAVAWSSNPVSLCFLLLNLPASVCCRPESTQVQRNDATVDSIYGHDAFFKEFAWLGPRLKRLLIDGLETELALDEQSRPEMAI
jgi:hypothetical protein